MSRYTPRATKFGGIALEFKYRFKKLFYKIIPNIVNEHVLWFSYIKRQYVFGDYLNEKVTNFNKLSFSSNTLDINLK